jgi:aquaporin Z
MERPLLRSALVELLATFILVYFAAGVVCVDAVTTPRGQNPGTVAQTSHQPGVVGIALAQGLVFAILLAATVPISGGYLNPAITVMLWVFNRLSTPRTAWFLAAQLLGAVLAGLCVRSTFDAEVLRSARVGAPHLNVPLVFSSIDRSALLAGTGIELVLTFSLVFAIFSVIPEGNRPRQAGLGAGGALAAGVILGFPLTGAALNPARWFGPVVWELAEGTPLPGHAPLADVFVYVAGPILGALLAGVVSFKVIAPVSPCVGEQAGRSADPSHGEASRPGHPAKAKR